MPATSQWYSPLHAPVDRHRHAGDAVAGAGERGADRARVQHEVTGVGAGVDARGDEVGQVAERAEAGGEHGHRRRRVDGVHREVGELVPHAPLDRRRTAADQATDRRAGAAAVVGGRDHEHVVAVGDQRGGERVDAGGVDAVVVGHEDAHGAHRTWRVRRRPPSARWRVATDG